MDDRRLQKRQPVNAVDKVTSYQCGSVESSSVIHQNELQHDMIGGELTRKPRSFPDQKHISPHRSPSSKLVCHSYKNNFDEVGLPHVPVGSKGILLIFESRSVIIQVIEVKITQGVFKLQGQKKSEFFK